MNKAVVLLSGGLDSTVLVAKLISEKTDLWVLSVDYGQRHRAELEAARRVVSHFGLVSHYAVVDMTVLGTLARGSSQTDLSVPVPEGHYAAETMKATIVPNRNMVLISLASAWATTLAGEGCCEVSYAAHSGDHFIYPDCRPEFVRQMGVAIATATEGKVMLCAPFIYLNKADLVRLGANLKTPLELTYSCYQGVLGIHCGKCGTCVERREAFQLAGIPDPTVYAL